MHSMLSLLSNIDLPFDHLPLYRVRPPLRPAGGGGRGGVAAPGAVGPGQQAPGEVRQVRRYTAQEENSNTSI